LGDGPLRFIEFKESLPPGWPEDLKRRRARFIHVTAAKTRNQPLDEAIIAECKAKGKMSISLEFAKLISPGVKRRLKLDPTSEFPKDGKLKDRLSKIKPANSSRVAR
jgi:hypothetical protein